MQSIYEKFHSQTYGSKDSSMELKETPGADLEGGRKAPDSPTESSSLIESIVSR